MKTKMFAVVKKGDRVLRKIYLDEVYINKDGGMTMNNFNKLVKKANKIFLKPQQWVEIETEDGRISRYPVWNRFS